MTKLTRLSIDSVVFVFFNPYSRSIAEKNAPVEPKVIIPFKKYHYKHSIKMMYSKRSSKFFYIIEVYFSQYHNLPIQPPPHLIQLTSPTKTLFKTIKIVFVDMFLITNFNPFKYVFSKCLFLLKYQGFS